ncbi:MAG TPA: hypothetical protein VK179_00970 [Bacteroidales bacterium]|nr:hypothetical protein [Bacteroidales bacterium]
MLTNNRENIDYLAEVVVSHLLSGQKAPAGVTVRLLGIFRRFFSHDVEKITSRTNTRNEQEWDIFLHREGFYDILPEGFFHTTSRKYFKDHNETVTEFSLHKTQEKNARLFFMPLEQEFYRHLVNKENFEQDFYFSPESIREFVDFFNLDEFGLDPYQKASLFFIMPYISSIAGNLALTETCLEIIIQEIIRIKQENNRAIKYTGSALPVGQMHLALESTLGESFPDANPLITIEIGPLMNSDDLMDYVAGDKRKLVEWLTGLFFQADLHTQFRILLKPEDEPFIIAGRDYESRLSYSTSI